MDDSIVPTQAPVPVTAKNSNDSMMEKLAQLLSGQGAAPQKTVEMMLPDYVSLWKKALFEGRKCMDLYDSDGKWGKKAPLQREDFSRMIFADLLERQRRNDFEHKT